MRALLLSGTAAFAVTLAVAPAYAGPATPTPITPTSQTTAFAGINWTFGAGKSSPELIIGVAQKQAGWEAVSGDCTTDISGAKASLHFALNGGIAFSKAKVTGLFGTAATQGEVGGGFGTGGAFAVAGLNGDYYHLGADFGGAGVEGYVGVHSIGPFTVTCADPD